MKRKDIDEFETLQGQLHSLYSEMNMLSKKSPNDAVNKFKLGLVNSVLKKSNTFLGSARQPFQDFQSFDEETLPSTSDVLIIVSQYLSAFEKYRTDNIHKAEHRPEWYWDGDDLILTSPPLKLLGA